MAKQRGSKKTAVRKTAAKGKKRRSRKTVEKVIARDQAAAFSGKGNPVRFPL
jgi:hypothetical protein